MKPSWHGKGTTRVVFKAMFGPEIGVITLNYDGKRSAFYYNKDAGPRDPDLLLIGNAFPTEQDARNAIEERYNQETHQSG